MVANEFFLTNPVLRMEEMFSEEFLKRKEMKLD